MMSVVTAGQRRIWIANHGPALDFYRNRRVLVVGADGFLGINCVYALQQLGAEIAILSRRPSPRAEGFTGTVFRGDLSDWGIIRSAVEGRQIVFDFAAVSSAVESNKDPYRSLKEECGPHLMLLQACAQVRQSPVVIFCSSRLVYGKPRYLPVDESHPLCPQSIHAVHKITVENYLKVFNCTHRLRSCVFRLSNPFGPYQSEGAKSWGIINCFARAAVRGQPIKIYGDGRQKRDYVFVDDVMNIFLLAAMDESCYGETFNVGGGRSISIGSAARKIAELAGGTPVRYKSWPEDYKAVETGDYTTDLSKLSRYLKLPEQTPFEEAMLLTLNHYREKSRMSQQAGSE